jgi:hypothetical protein
MFKASAWITCAVAATALTGFLFSLPSSAAGGRFIAEAKWVSGDVIQLYAEKDVCQGRAMRASYVYRNGRKVDGCWRMEEKAEVHIVFFDGDVVRVPGETFKKPEEV